MVKELGFTKAKLRKARAYVGEGKLLLGAKLLEEIIAHDPQEGYAWLEYAEVQKELRKYGDSMKSFEQALTFAPEDRKAYVLARIAHLCELSMGPAYAKEYYDLALEAMPESVPWILILSGVNLTMMEEHDEAEKLFIAASSIDSDERGEAYLNLAYLYRSQGAYEKAKAAAQKSHSLDPSVPLAKEILHSIQL